jgi:hypothetical protein
LKQCIYHVILLLPGNKYNWSYARGTMGIGTHEARGIDGLSEDSESLGVTSWRAVTKDRD